MRSSQDWDTSSILVSRTYRYNKNMKAKTIIMLVLGLALLVVLFVTLKPNTLNEYNDVVQDISVKKIFNLNVSGGKIIIGQSVLRVNDGDSVSIRIISDTPDELHLHGYDLHLNLEKGVEATLSFVASTTGRFEFELEKAKIELGVLEVLPRQ